MVLDPNLFCVHSGEEVNPCDPQYFFGIWELGSEVEASSFLDSTLDVL